MKHVFAIFFFLFTIQFSNAQFTLKLVVNSAATKPLDDVYVAGSFNNWNPHDPKYKLKPFGTSRRAIILNNVAAGKYEFKFTRGIDKWETTAKGEDIPNHEVTVADDVTKDYMVAGWKDDFPDKPKHNTASKQVKIVDTAFTIPQLNRTRKIWIYLPKGYETFTKKYPVLYMHDGQNLFNEQTAPFGEWGVDEALDSLSKKGIDVILVGIDHGGDKRMTEYDPYDNEKYGKGEGKKYVDFLALTLKPFIDRKYRTIPDSMHTFIAGSSMGGLISMYALIKYPGVFGGGGIFSPAFYLAPDIFTEVANANLGKAVRKFYFYAGGKESNVMVPDMDKMLRIVEAKGNYKTRRVMDPTAKHNEAAWRSEFADFIQFLLP